MKTSKPDIEIGDDIVEGANLALSNNLAVIVAVLGLVIVVLAGLLFSVKGKLNALQAKYDFFTQGEEANIDTVLTKTLNEKLWDTVTFISEPKITTSSFFDLYTQMYTER